MSKVDVYLKMNRAKEITLSVKGRNQAWIFPRPVWFTHEGKTVHLLPNRVIYRVVKEPAYRSNVEDFSYGLVVAAKGKNH